MPLNWVKCDQGLAWCSFFGVDLSNVTVSGVYIIWRLGAYPAFVRVGQGNIAQRIAAHRNDPVVAVSGLWSPMFVTWAEVPWYLQDGVEAYLAEVCSPLVGERFPNVTPIPVMLPA